jgi:uncharacterized membrane protein YfcA
MYFPTSGVDVALWLPPLVAFCISCFTSMGGLSGAFLLLPFQMSVLGFVSPAVTPTNHLYNVVAIPSGVYRYVREGRMAWPLTGVIIAGTLPGVFLGSLIRVKFLPDPRHFKLFVGCVLLYVGGRMLFEGLLKRADGGDRTQRLEESFQRRSRQEVSDHGAGGSDGGSADRLGQVQTQRFGLRRAAYRFYGEVFSFSPVGLFVLTLFVGIIGGTYGIGGGAIIAPFLVAFYRLPIYTIAGATLMGTCLTSFAAVIFFSVLGARASGGGVHVTPDWPLGILFGIGGFVGMYVGARTQRFVPARPLKILVGVLVAFVALRYIAGFFNVSPPG